MSRGLRIGTKILINAFDLLLNFRLHTLDPCFYCAQDQFLFWSFGNNYRNLVITGILRDILQNPPTLRPKWEAEPGDPRRTDKCLSILGKSAKKAIDSNTGFW